MSTVIESLNSSIDKIRTELRVRHHSSVVVRSIDLIEANFLCFAGMVESR